MEKQKILIILTLILALTVIPLVNADVIIPTVTKVYFEQNSKPYINNIEFTVKGYGYSYPPGPSIEKVLGNYAPEVVFSFTSRYNDYGDKIYENYYSNYRHIDYYELEGKTWEGKNFIIGNMEKIPINCYNIREKDGVYYSDITNCLNKPYSEFPDDISPFDYCKDTFVEIEKETDEQGNPIDRHCELKFNLDNAKWIEENVPDSNINSTINTDQKLKIKSKGFWGNIGCFFKELFGRSC